MYTCMLDLNFEFNGKITLLFHSDSMYAENDI